MNISHERLAATFQEWQRRFREEPAAFMADWQVAAQGVDEYGEAAARYLEKLAAEVGALDALPGLA